jgi:hypothetical protein
LDFFSPHVLNPDERLLERVGPLLVRALWGMADTDLPQMQREPAIRR